MAHCMIGQQLLKESPKIIEKNNKMEQLGLPTHTGILDCLGYEKASLKMKRSKTLKMDFSIVFSFNIHQK